MASKPRVCIGPYSSTSNGFAEDHCPEDFLNLTTNLSGGVFYIENVRFLPRDRPHCVKISFIDCEERCATIMRLDIDNQRFYECNTKERMTGKYGLMTTTYGMEINFLWNLMRSPVKFTFMTISKFEKETPSNGLEEEEEEDEDEEDEDEDDDEEDSMFLHSLDIVGEGELNLNQGF